MNELGAYQEKQDTITAGEVAGILDTCRNVFKNFKVNQYIIQIWFKNLQNFTFHEVRFALDQWIGNEDRQTGPSVAEIKRACQGSSSVRRQKFSQRANLSESQKLDRAFLDNRGLARVDWGNKIFSIVDKAKLVEVAPNKWIPRMDFILDNFGEKETSELLKAGFESLSNEKLEMGSVWSTMLDPKNREKFKQAAAALEAMAWERKSRKEGFSL